MKKYNQDSLGGFGDTQWSIVLRAQDLDSKVRRAALNELLKTYIPALRAHLVIKRGIDRNRADDLLQGFLTDKVLERDLVSQADRGKGRFRSLLLRSLENYRIDEGRRDGAKKRAPQCQHSIDPDESASSGIALPTHDGDVFEAVWARGLLTDAMTQVREECKSKEQPHVWEVFRLRVLKPALENTRAPSYEELVEQCQLRTPTQVLSALKTAKQRFERALKKMLQQSLLEDETVEEELAGLRKILATAGALGLEDPDTAPGPDSEMTLSEQSLPRLAPMLLNDERSARLWSLEDLGQIYAHLLSLPLPQALRELQGGDGVAEKANEDSPRGDSLRDLLTRNDPSREALEAVKRSARMRAKDRLSDFPVDVSTMIYYAAIASALARHNARITKLQPEELRHGLQQMLAYDWIDDATRRLLRDALARLESAAMEPA